MSPPQTKQVEYYRAAPSGMELERVRPTRSPSDPPPIAPLTISKRGKPANIIVPQPEIVRPPRSPARANGNFDAQPPAPGPPPAGPLPPVPRDETMDPLLLRAAVAKERRRQSKHAEQGDLASLERSMRRLSRISLASGEPTSPTDSLSPSIRAEKLLRRLSRQSDVRLPADYGRVGISGFSANSAPVSPGLQPASVPMSRQPNMLGLGLGLAQSDSFTSMSSLTSASSMSDDTLSTLPSEATIKLISETPLGSLSSATTASTTSLVTPVSPPTTHTLLTPMSPPKPLRLKGSLNLRIPSRSPSPSPIPDLLKDYRHSVYPAYEAANRESSLFPSYHSSSPATELVVPSSSRSNSRSPSPIAPTRQRPGARARVHSDLAPPSPTSTEAVDSHEVLVTPMRPSLEAQTTPKPATSPEPNRPSSPDIAYILRTTPRPTRKTSVGSLASASTTGRRVGGGAPPSAFRGVPSRSGSLASVPSRASSSTSNYGATASSAGFDGHSTGPEVFFGEQYDSDDSDSDLDLATPLPHMMLRVGLLSPRSTIITDALETPIASKLSARGEALRARGEKVWKAEARRKVRHRDGQNLRDGVGLTTGLGWSDSEDEDAPSPLRRRLSSVLLAKAQSRPPSQLSRQSTMSLSRRSTLSNLESSSVSSASNPRTPAHPPMSLPLCHNPPLPSYAHTLPLTPGSLPEAAAVDEFGKLDFPMPPTATSWRGQPSPGLRKPPSVGMLKSASATGASTATSTVSLLRSRTVSSTSSQGASQGHSSPRASTVSRPSRASVASQRSMMPPPRFNRQATAGTRLSAPEALRQSQSSIETTRRLSGS
ncbi:unnamed protein product [Rhizoctonia solani]|uniref:Uncharacterized protein n=1 Tax=Rhizoctonia solani TaxID=456999 RepID=A0A8H3E642_9AGAM|nr:unnamed protein product [Rhizoctonia solani]